MKCPAHAGETPSASLALLEDLSINEPTRGQFLEGYQVIEMNISSAIGPTVLPSSIIRIINLASRDRDGRMVQYCDRVGPRNASRGSRADYSRSSFE
jgi:hypothetical protein